MENIVSSLFTRESDLSFCLSVRVEPPTEPAVVQVYVHLIERGTCLGEEEHSRSCDTPCVESLVSPYLLRIFSLACLSL